MHLVVHFVHSLCWTLSSCLNGIVFLQPRETSTVLSLLIFSFLIFAFFFLDNYQLGIGLFFSFTFLFHFIFLSFYSILGEISTSFLVIPLNSLFHHLTLIFKSFFHSSQNPSFRMYYLPNPENCKKNFKVIFCFLNPVSPRVRVFCLFSYISFILVVLSLLFTYASLGIFQCQIQKNDRWCGITVQLCIYLASVGFPEPF